MVLVIYAFENKEDVEVEEFHSRELASSFVDGIRTGGYAYGAGTIYSYIEGDVPNTDCSFEMTAIEAIASYQR
jgi:hypothetical protein